MKYPVLSLVVGAVLLCAALPGHADENTAPSKHQLMKECMAKQKASDGGMPKEDMKKNCKDVTNTEHENAKVEKAAEESSEAPKH
jgi:hypothetical protein